jgi:hypothetical protein
MCELVFAQKRIEDLWKIDIRVDSLMAGMGPLIFEVAGTRFGCWYLEEWELEKVGNAIQVCTVQILLTFGLRWCDLDRVVHHCRMVCFKPYGLLQTVWSKCISVFLEMIVTCSQWKLSCST